MAGFISWKLQKHKMSEEISKTSACGKSVWCGVGDIQWGKRWSEGTMFQCSGEKQQILRNCWKSCLLERAWTSSSRIFGVILPAFYNMRTPKSPKRRQSKNLFLLAMHVAGITSNPGDQNLLRFMGWFLGSAASLPPPCWPGWGGSEEQRFVPPSLQEHMTAGTQSQHHCAQR